jgi:hypothetical protein
MCPTFSFTVGEGVQKETKMRFWILAAIALMLVAAPDSAQSQNSAVKGPTRTIALTGPSFGDVYGPPGGKVSIYSAGSLQGNFPIDFPDNMLYRVHNLACRTGWYTNSPDLAVPARQAYAIYLKVDDPPQTIRVQTFNTVCSAGGGGGFAGNGSFSNFAYIGGFPFDIETDTIPGLFTSRIEIEIYLESDDGIDGPEDPGSVLVLSGFDPPPSP